MQKKKFKLVVTVMLTALLVAIFAISATAEIVVVNGVVTGLNPDENYQYAQVTLENYTTPSYTNAAAGATKIEGLTAGIWYINNTTKNELVAVWIPGDAEDRNDIGFVEAYNDDGTLCDRVVSEKTSTTEKNTGTLVWKAGVWTGHGYAYPNKGKNSPYYLTGRGDEDVTIAKLEEYLAGTLTRTDIINLMEASHFKYAYAPEEIIPVEELYSVSFKTGLRQSALRYSYVDSAPDKVLKSKYVLYTMEEDGSVVSHEALIPTVYGSNNVQGVAIAENFPDAKGWVIGIKIHSFGEVPSLGISFTKEPNGNGAYVNTLFAVEYLPDGYLTATKEGVIAIPAQYNGLNTSYIEGYGDGSFNPDGNITKAETATLLARLKNPGEEIPSLYTSKFADCTVNDWFYNAVSYLETLSAFDHIEGARLNPNKAITRGEFSQMVYALSNCITVRESTFDDVDENTEYFAAICSLADMGIINGYADGTFRPDATITRAEAVTILNRLINLVANEDTVVKSELKNTFNDVDGHWAEYQILMAANDNVKSKRHLEASSADLFDNGSEIEIENEHVKVAISKSNGKVASIINKYDGTDISAVTTTPWFAYITSDNAATFTPTTVEIKDNRLIVTFSNEVKACFVVKATENYFTVELDSELPLGITSINFGNLSVNTEFSEELDSYRLSAISMNTNTNMVNFPGGKALKTTGYAKRKFGTMGAKLGITFSKYGGETGDDHRNFLKEITDAIDETVGMKSTFGGAYSKDNPEVYYDYVITSSLHNVSSSNRTVDTLTEAYHSYFSLLQKHSINQVYLHQSSSGAFVQGDFNFISARTTEEAKTNTFITAKTFNERVTSVANQYGIDLCLHTYSSLVDKDATTILTDPKWQKQIAYYESENLTLGEGITADATNIAVIEDAINSGSIGITGTESNGVPAYADKNTTYNPLPYRGPNTGYFLIDEEIIMVKMSVETGDLVISRGQCGTTAVAHDEGAEIRHLLGYYSKFQPIPGSELFYHVADLIAEAYNDGGFKIIYLDGLESFARTAFLENTADNWYYYSTFVQRIISGCNTAPMIAGSNFVANFWNARSRAGAIDHGRRGHKIFNYYHMVDNLKFNDYYLASTLGWFHFAPDYSYEYKNAQNKTMFLDDLDYMGTMGIAFDMGITANGFTLANYTTYAQMTNNTMYHSLYSRLRKAGYFSEAVKKTLREGILNGKEYKVEEQSDGSWAFREMTYVKHKVYDLTDTVFATGSGTNPYDAQVPYIRIEQRYSTLGNASDALSILTLDETAEISTLAGKYDFTPVDITNNNALKVKVYGNGSKDDGILIVLNSQSAQGSLHFFIPTSHTGWREFILIDADQGEYEGYEFEGYTVASMDGYTFRTDFPFTELGRITIALCGDCEGVMIDDITAYPMEDTPVEKVTLTVNGTTITFDTSWVETYLDSTYPYYHQDNKYMGSGDYIEYNPELGKAYLHYYEDTYNSSTGAWTKSTAHVREITVSTVPSVPSGDFTFTYGATKSSTNGSDAPLRAKVVFGFKSAELIANEATHEVPTVEIPEDLQYITYTNPLEN